MIIIVVIVIESYYVAQVGLQFMTILLPLPPKCSDPSADTVFSFRLNRPRAGLSLFSCHKLARVASLNYPHGGF